jgi:hypothetical protein
LSRASKASQVNPCLPPLAGSSTHVRVNAGQEFLIEWASGHPGTDNYMIVLESSNAEKMNLHTERRRALIEPIPSVSPAAVRAPFRPVHLIETPRRSVVVPVSSTTTSARLPQHSSRRRPPHTARCITDGRASRKSPALAAMSRPNKTSLTAA